MNKKSLYQRSWIRPNISWLNLPESTVLRIEAEDPDLVELIASGRKSILKCPKEDAECVLKLSGPRETLESSLITVVNIHAQLHELSPDLKITRDRNNQNILAQANLRLNCRLVGFPRISMRDFDRNFFL
jgi:hypothetical protein